ncbi:PTS system, galactitol-specific IIA component [Peribacillus simplex]|uniref:PTS system, galactitol-specific IIA component n=1 Tax=Peribacillus simplex TaxID=1478 RepID=A0A9X8RAJ4_9BACI|nr:PTS sugar transporter subunit IIA [Peribacillus simplex]SIR59067.1 PTS system, galactitol-specific IIA component [Peribacillus simplex]
MTKIIISEESIFTDLEASNKEEALRILTDSLLEQGFIHDDFYDSLLNREQNFPTGLESFDAGIAIPHTDPKHVKQDSIAVAVLEKPITFQNMVDKSMSIDVKIIFLLGLSQSTKHLNILRQIMGLIKEKGALEEISNMSKSHLYSHLVENLSTE